ncbi:MAG: glutamyl-tRNA reductase [Bacteroidales bacterium]|nr:glutamyl-tRNA reductase [Bacteroidales bacterium]
MYENIGIIGLNHKSAPVEVREKIAFNKEQIIDFLNMLIATSEIDGAVVLSTCNRSEIYFHYKTSCRKGGFEFAFNHLFSFKNLTINYRDYFYSHLGDRAVKHLFRVSSGLNSMALGEDQIIGQVKDAFFISENNNSAGPVLTRLFHKGFEAGKRVRTETRINEGASSISSASVELVSRNFSITKQKILLIGAGQTGELSLQSLIKKGCENIYITNRTHQTAIDLARNYQAQAFPIQELETKLGEVDIVLISTGAQSPLITKEIISNVKAKHTKKELFLVDLSVPRNIEPEIKSIEGIRLIDVDDLEEIVTETYENRKAEIIHAEEILKEITIEYMNWLSSRNLTPIFQQLQQNIRKVNQQEFDGFKKNNGDDYDMAWKYGDHISEKISRLLIRNLKDVTDNGKKVEFLKMFNQLFELSANEQN